MTTRPPKDLSQFNPAFLIGAPRSGTTWLQRMLGAHDEIATPQELGLLDRIIPELDKTYQADFKLSKDEWRRRRFMGLPSLVTQEEFDDLLKIMIAFVYEKILSLKPGARVVLLKRPSAALHIPIILRLVPQARLIHIVRDGRDVLASRLAAIRGWQREWRSLWPLHVAIQSWQDHVEGARQAKELAPDRYLEVRYEDLLDNGVPILERCLHHCGVEASPQLARHIYEMYSFEQMIGSAEVPESIIWAGEVTCHVGRPGEPSGFHRKGEQGSWESDLTPYQRYVFARLAGKFLIELGYEQDESWVDLGPARRMIDSTRFTLATARRRVGSASRGALRSPWRRNPIRAATRM